MLFHLLSHLTDRQPKNSQSLCCKTGKFFPSLKEGPPNDLEEAIRMRNHMLFSFGTALKRPILTCDPLTTSETKKRDLYRHEELPETSRRAFF
jgi:hypothetical protein